MIVIANPSETMALGLKELLFAPNQTIIELNDNREVLRFCLENEPDLVIGVIGHFTMDVIDIAEDIHQMKPEIHFLFFIAEADETMLYKAMSIGLCLSLPDMIRWGTAQLTQATASLYEPLTKREREVLTLISEGKTNQDIAETLFISLKTVKSHVSNILSKLGVEDRTQAAVFALKNHLV